jgi:hypothetical protein
MIKFPPYMQQEMDKFAKQAKRGDDEEKIHGGE